MSNVQQLSAQHRTSSSLSMALTVAGCWVLSGGNFIDSASLSSIQKVTPSSASVVFSQGINNMPITLAQLEKSIEQLWEDVDTGSISATEKELEMANLLLEKFPNNTI